jgi:hypothetical protein
MDADLPREIVDLIDAARHWRLHQHEASATFALIQAVDRLDGMVKP